MADELGETGFAHRVPVPREALLIDMRPMTVRRPSHECDVAMSQLDEVLGRAARRVVVVDGDDARLLSRADDADDRPSDLGQLVDLLVDRLETDGDEPVEALAREEVAEDPFAAGRAGLGVVQREVESAFQEGLLDAFEHFREEPAVEIRHDDADVLRAPGRQPDSAR